MRALIVTFFWFTAGICFVTFVSDSEAYETKWLCGIFEGGEVRCLNRETEEVYQVNPLFFIPSNTRVLA